MKVKALILALIVGPVLGYIVSGIVLWRIYELANLISFVSVADFELLTVGVFSLIWMVVTYLGFKPDKTARKKRKKKSLTEKEFTLKDVRDTFKPSIKKALLEFIIIGDGKNLHQIVPYTETAEYTAGDTTYKVENSNLMIKKPFIGKPKLIAIFQKDGQPVKMSGEECKVTAEILSLAQRSGALSRTINEMFSSHLDMKKILFFVVLGIVAVVAFLIISGGLF
jgi:hypothetical protein